MKKGEKMGEEQKRKISRAMMGDKNPNFGKKHSEKIRRKISKAKEGSKHSQETKLKIGKSLKGRIGGMLGKTHSVATRKKIGNANEGKNHWNYGKKHSQQTKQKMSEIKKGKRHSEETKIKMSNVFKGENNPNWKGGIEVAKEKQKNNLKYRLSNRIRAGINYSLKKGVKNHRTWGSLVGYTPKELKFHLESTMPIGYTWNDFLSGELHIDHIIPISYFSFSTPEDQGFKDCWALGNLRLLPKMENLKKSNKLIKPLQMNIKI